MKKVLLILITGFLFYNTANATASAVTFTAKQTGNWSDPNTWTITGTNTNSHTYPHSAGAYSDTLTQHDLVVIPSGFTVTLTANSYAYSMTLQGAIADAGFSLTIYQSGTSSSGATPLTTLSGNSGSFTGGGSLILTGHGYIKIYGGNGLTVDNLTVSQTVASSYPFFANICAMNSGTLIVTGTLALNSSGVFCLGTKALTLSNSISGATYFSGTNVQTGDGTSSLSAGTTVSATGVLAFKNSAVTFPSNLISTSSPLTGLTIDVGSGNTYTLPSNLTMAAGKLTLTSGTLSTGTNTLSVGLTGSAIAPGASLLIPSGGTANFNSTSLTIQSSSAGSGSIQAVAGTLSGVSNVIVQRYVGTSQQWRMVGFPLTAVTTISETALAAFYTAGYSAYSYNEGADDQTNYGNSGTANAGWTAFTSGTITANQGLLLSGGTTSSTINFTGPLNTGTQNIPLTKSKSGWNLIANPFASNINWTTIASNNSSLVNNAIYRYDPTSTAYATYVSGSSTGNQSNVIENGAGFFVQATSSGNLSIQESDKITTAPLASLFGLQPIIAQDKSIIKLSLLKEGETYGDEVVLRWGVDPATDGFDGKYDAYDLGRVKGADLSVIGNDGTVYSIFHGSELKSSSIENRTVQLGIKNIEEGNYQMGIQLLSAIAGNNKAYLFDSYTNQYTLIDGSTDNYNFLVTSDQKSQSATRFAVVMNYKAPDNAVSTNLPVMLLNNPSSGNLFSLYSKNNYKQLQWQIVDASGRLLQAGLLSDVLKGSTHQINAGNAGQGNYFIKLNGDGNSLPVLKALKN